MTARGTPLLVMVGLLASNAFAQPAATPTDAGHGDADLALAVVDTTPALSYFHAAGNDSGGRSARRELVGLLINGVEARDGIELLWAADDSLHVPLRALAGQLQLPVVDEADAIVLRTPLGDTRFETRELRPGNADAFAPLPLVATRLAAQVRFDQNDYALRVDLRWSPGTVVGASPEQPILPDALPPGADLSRLRGSLWHYRGGNTDRSDAQIEASGRLGPGVWQVRYLDTSASPARLQDYHWRVRNGQWSGLVGHQLVGNHPLLPAFDLTGAQGAWTNAPERLYSPIEPDRLVADRPGAVRTLRGEGVPGGVAELRIDDRVIERQGIPLDGWFEFVSVPMPSGYSRVEVVVYDNDVSAAAQTRIDFSDRASDRLLASGEYVLHGGIGQGGNPLDELRRGGGAAGFARGRAALGDRVTMETQVQSSERNGDYALAGADINLGRTGIASLAAANGESGNAWLAGIEGGGRHWFWRGYATGRDAGFNSELTPALTERSGEIGWRLWPYAELSVVGRQRREDGSPDIDFIKPAARLRPMQGLHLSARPDFEGHYVYDAEWLPANDVRVSAHRDRRIEQLQLDHRFAPSWQATAAVTRDRDLDRRRDSVIVGYQEPLFYGWTAEAGVLHSEGDFGMLARAGRELLPGVQFRAEVRRDPLYRGRNDGGETIASLGVLFDLGRAGRRFTRANSAARNTDGAIAGSVMIRGATLPAPEGVVVRINGQPRTRTDQAGRFHVSGLQPGVYRVEIDEEGLPIELSLSGSGHWAQVAAGASTSVDFRAELVLGVAGRITLDDAVSSERVRVIVLNDTGPVQNPTRPNDFGYYRIDGLPPGEYRLRLLLDDVEIATLPVTLTSQFLFNQNFILNPSPATERNLP